MKNASSSNSPKLTGLFNNQLEKAPLEVKIAFSETLELLKEDPNSEILRNHVLNKLGKKYFGLWSIDVAGDWRAIYRKNKNGIVFEELGTHTDFYK